MSAFRDADRESIRRTIRFMHSWRDLADKLPAVTVPTLLIAGDLADQHWQPVDAQAAATTMPNARAAAVTGAGHIGPLRVDTDLIAQTVTEFWQSLP
jgi:pimeloyl-ACP methyl ester carboxylesterase